MNPTVNSEGAAELLNVHVETVERMARRGEIPAAKFGKQWVYPTADLIRLVKDEARRQMMERRGEEKTGRLSVPELP